MKTMSLRNGAKCLKQGRSWATWKREAQSRFRAEERAAMAKIRAGEEEAEVLLPPPPKNSLFREIW
jgi:hypothetical protein